MEQDEGEEGRGFVKSRRKRWFSILAAFLIMMMGIPFPGSSLKAASPETDLPSPMEKELAHTEEPGEPEEGNEASGTGQTGTEAERTPLLTEEEKQLQAEAVQEEEEEISVSGQQETDAEYNEEEELQLYGTLQEAMPFAENPASWDEVIEEAVKYLRGEDGILLDQDFLGKVSHTDTDWAVLAISRLGFEDDYRGFLAAADADVKKKYDASPSIGLHKDNATEWHRLAIAVLAAGGDPTNVGGHDLIADGTYNCMVGAPWKQGTNGAIWALIALDSRNYQVPGNSKYTRDDLINYLLENQKAGGGWAIDPSPEKGDAANIDVTAMGIQALAPYHSDERVEEAISRAWDLVLLGVDETVKYGIGTNCETVAQAIIAGCCLGLDPEEVTLESGATLTEALALHIHPDGGFYHDARDSGGGANLMATHQALEAIAAWKLYQNGEGCLYAFGDAGSIGEEEIAQRRAALKSDIQALPSALSAKDRQTIERYLWELNHLGAWEAENPVEYGELKGILEKALAQVEVREELVAVLNQDIWDQIDPLRINQSDKGTVEALMKRYSTLYTDEQKLLENRTSLLEAAKVVDSLADGIIPSRVFQNMRSTKEDFTYYGTTRTGTAYTYVFEADTIKSTNSVNAGVEITKGTDEDVPGSVAMVELGQRGSMNGSVRLSFDYIGNAGSYGVYYMNNEKLSIQSAGQASVTLGKAELTVNQGGRYWLANKTVRIQGNNTTVRSYLNNSSLSLNGASTRFIGNEVGGSQNSTNKTSKNADSEKRETVKATPVRGQVKAVEFEEIEGQDMNLLVEGTLVDGVPYTITFNGKDIVKPADFSYIISAECEHQEEIRQLAESPVLLCMKDAGRFPGKALITISLDLEDEGLLLFCYDEKERKAEYVKKVTVSDKKLMFTLEEGGHYFIAKRAKAGALNDGEKAETASYMEDNFNGWNEAEELILTGNKPGWTSQIDRYLPSILALLAFPTGIIIGRNPNFGRRKKVSVYDEE